MDCVMISVIETCENAEGVSTEARYFLYRLAAGCVVERKAFRELAGVSERVAARALNELLDRDFARLSNTQNRPSSGGAAVLQVAVTPTLASKLEAARSKVTLRFDELAARIMSGTQCVAYQLSAENTPIVKGRAGWLSPANRLLLALLLELADEGGVVRRVRPKELGRLSGMTGVQVRYQLEKLLDLGFIRAMVAGVTGRQMFGVSPGAYFLNLSHSEYGDLAEGAISLTYPSATFDLIGAYDLRGVAQIYRDLARRGGKFRSDALEGALCMYGNFDAEGAKRLEALFDGVGSSNLFGFLQMQVEGYASWLLTHYRGRLGDTDLPDTLGLCARIRQDLFGFREEVFVNRDMQGEDAAVRLVAEMAFGLARQVSSVVSVSYKDSYMSNLDRQLVPFEPGVVSWVIMPRILTASVHEVSIMFLPLNKRGALDEAGRLCRMKRVEKEWHIDEEVLDGNDLRFKVGLMTRPRTSSSK